MVTVINGELYSDLGAELEPCMVVAGDVLLKYGHRGLCKAYYEVMRATYENSHLDTNELVYMDFSEQYAHGLNVYDVAYIVNRAVGNTATGFIQDVVRHLGNEGFVSWVRNEERFCPVDV
jgi:hypothetical protein